jgi:hypothetical protein
MASQSCGYRLCTTHSAHCHASCNVPWTALAPRLTACLRAGFPLETCPVPVETRDCRRLHAACGADAAAGDEPFVRIMMSWVRRRLFGIAVADVTAIPSVVLPQERHSSQRRPAPARRTSVWSQNNCAMRGILKPVRDPESTSIPVVPEQYGCRRILYRRASREGGSHPWGRLSSPVAAAKGKDPQTLCPVAHTKANCGQELARFARLGQVPVASGAHCTDPLVR